MEIISNLVKEITAKFIEELREEDRREAKRVAARGCPYCKGVLHVANYPRRPRGLGSKELGMSRRESFCCRDCRRRVTPKSVRFLGRKVFTAISLVSTEVLRLGGVSRSQVCHVIGMSAITLQRWSGWWNDPVKGSQWWQEIMARFIPQLPDSHYVGEIFRSICPQFRFSPAAESPSTAPPSVDSPSAESPSEEPDSVAKGLKNVLSILSPLTVPSEYSRLYPRHANFTQKVSTAVSSESV